MPDGCFGDVGAQDVALTLRQQEALDLFEAQQARLRAALAIQAAWRGAACRARRLIDELRLAAYERRAVRRPLPRSRYPGVCAQPSGCPRPRRWRGW
jgi:hypothetical protein